MTPDELTQTLGDRMAKSLRYAGITAVEMGDHLELHRNTISAYLTDKTVPKHAVLHMWAERVGLPYQWLKNGVWTDEDKPAP